MNIEKGPQEVKTERKDAVGWGLGVLTSFQVDTREHPHWQVRGI